MKPISTCTHDERGIFARQTQEVAGAPQGAALLELDLPGPLDLESTLECGQAFRWKRAEGPDAGTWYKGVIGPAGVMVKTCSGSRLRVLYDPNIVDADELAKLVYVYFSLDDDLEGIHRLLSETCAPTDRAPSEAGGHDALRQAMLYARGLRILRQDPWECLVSYIISANKNIPAICKSVEYLAQTLGKPCGLGLYAFPGPEVLLAAGVECVKQSRCGYRAPYIIDAAEKVMRGEVDLRAFQEMPTDEARRHLMKVKGVGPKVADCVLLFAYHRLDVFPVDVWIARSMAAFFMGGGHITPRQAREEGCRRFGPFAGYAQQILYHYYRNVLRGRL